MPCSGELSYLASCVCGTRSCVLLPGQTAGTSCPEHQAWLGLSTSPDIRHRQGWDWREPCAGRMGSRGSRGSRGSNAWHQTASSGCTHLAVVGTCVTSWQGQSFLCAHLECPVHVLQAPAPGSHQSPAWASTQDAASVLEATEVHLLCLPAESPLFKCGSITPIRDGS